MNLWIRSQDKKRLIPNPNLYAIWSKENNVAYIGDTMVGHIAKYKTEERALEVLDEIQNILKAKFMVRMDGNLKNIEKFLDISNFSYIQSRENADIKIINTYVYEMPKE